MTGPGESQGKPPGPEGMPASPLSALTVAAAGFHEMFLSFVAAGFSEQQALHMVTAVLVDSFRHQRGQGAS